MVSNIISIARKWQNLSLASTGSSRYQEQYLHTMYEMYEDALVLFGEYILYNQIYISISA